MNSTKIFLYNFFDKSLSSFVPISNSVQRSFCIVRERNRIITADDSGQLYIYSISVDHHCIDFLYDVKVPDGSWIKKIIQIDSNTILLHNFNTKHLYFFNIDTKEFIKNEFQISLAAITDLELHVRTKSIVLIDNRKKLHIIC